MDHVVWEERPVLHDPVAIIAFEGWGDAGSASSMAVNHLLDEADAERFATIDADDFFDFQVRRPLVELDEDGVRSLLWPDIELWTVSLPGVDRDVVVVTGAEPHYRWKLFARELVGALLSVGVEQVVALGAFIGQVPHTLPVPLVGTAREPGLLERHGLFPSGYEGPTGIIGVLTQALAGAGIETVSVWAAVPHYLSNQDYPPAGLALLEKALEVLELSADTSELESDVADFRRQVDEALEDPELRSYVEELEAETLNAEAPAERGEGDPAERLVEEIERFLREG